MQLADASGEAQVLEAAKQGLSKELERIKHENKDLLQKAALLESLTAEAEALRHQVCVTQTIESIPSQMLKWVSREATS